MRNLTNALLLSMFLPTTVIAASATDQPLIIEVSGQGQVEAEPDQAMISATLTRKGQHNRQLLNQVSAEMARILSALKAAGIAEKDIQAGQVQLQQQWRHENGRREADGYEARRPITLRVQPLNRYPELIDLLNRTGVNTVNGVQFDFSNRQALNDQALTQASQDAQRKAELLAKSVGGGHCRAVSLSTERSNTPVPHLRMAAMEVADGAYNPGSQQISATVSGRFSCR